MAKSRHSSDPPSGFIPDRGPARYFHGRKKIRRDFKELLRYASQKTWGTTFLIQGAPGVGKTALLEEIASDALENQWDVVDINLDDLYNSFHMAQTIGESHVARKQTVTTVDAKLLSRDHIKEVAGDSSVTQVLQRMNPDLGVILILDEAQRIGAFSGTPNEIPVMGTLDTLHNGRLPHPVILLAAGLRTTLKAFGSLKISRFAEDCLVELGALNKASERAVIQDWLKKKGKAKGDPTAWIDAIVKETHGWPRHVQSYAKRAADHLEAGGGIMTTERLNASLEAGREGRKVYYKQRVGDFYGDEIQCLVNSILDNPSGPPTSRIEIISSLAEKYGDRSKAEKLVKDFIEAGILEKSGVGLAVPIPSMHTWLKEEYSRERHMNQNSGLERSYPNPPAFVVSGEKMA
ncbi:MAG: ATP-binding protein [Bacteroidota bacterium]|nr:ATP-binding protein [Bacteroidota bacterium]MDE2646587.1 ATP-binding protein [Bacteroidota bacterium]